MKRLATIAKQHDVVAAHFKNEEIIDSDVSGRLLSERLIGELLVILV